MRCIKCGLRFSNKEVTAEDEKGRDLCPACGEPINPKEIELAITITDAINGSFDHKLFVEQMSKEHRTLQSEFTSLCLDWLLKCREMYETENYDGRNEYACRSGKVLMDYLEKGDF
jgi:NAD-dependent SIR2 family protein deacetylase